MYGRILDFMVLTRKCLSDKSALEKLYNQHFLCPFLQSTHFTTSSALHGLFYKGPLRLWPNFVQDVQGTHDIHHGWKLYLVKREKYNFRHG